VALGAGFSTDHGPRAQIGLDHRNLFGTGWQAESVLIVEGSRQRLFANARSPLSAEARYLGLGSSLDRQDITGERVLRTSTYGGIGQRRVDGDGFLALTHQSENRRLEAAAGSQVERDSRMALVLGYTHTLNRVDSPTEPQRGYTLSGQLSGASQSLGSDRSFIRAYARARRFWPVASDGLFAGGTLVGLAELGVVAAGSREDIPSENLFRTGGAQSLRGYRYQSLGVPEAGAITGGRYLVLGSLEYQHPVTSVVKAAVFYDRGNATDSLAGFSTYAGYGAGARWKTPIGPLMVDLAWGEDSRRPRLHLAVGYGF
jgi:translocation and assembly module TamA